MSKGTTLQSIKSLQISKMLGQSMASNLFPHTHTQINASKALSFNLFMWSFFT
jgi:hypothetical protein